MRVGTSNKGINPVRYIRDHPHACGDKSINTNSSSFLSGSSPCVWGQEIGGASTVKCDRIIPMRVGTSKKNLKEFLKT